MTERLFTPIIKNNEGARLWLCSSLGNASLRLAGEFTKGDTVAELSAADGLGGVATRIAFYERSDGSQLDWCGLPFMGDVLDVSFPGGEQVSYSFDELDQRLTPHIEQKIDRN